MYRYIDIYVYIHACVGRGVPKTKCVKVSESTPISRVQQLLGVGPCSLY